MHLTHMNDVECYVHRHASLSLCAYLGTKLTQWHKSSKPRKK
jgi:hypothetical protein